MIPPPTGPRFRPSDRTKWILGSIAFVLVVVVTLAMSWVNRDDSQDAASTSVSNPVPSPSLRGDHVASADDEDPVSIVTDEPTCPEWEPIRGSLVTATGNGWLARDPAVPATAWTQQQREQHREVAAAMRLAADRAVALAESTPHRVMHELYSQAIAYWRAYAESVDRYRPPDDHLARTAINAAESINAICAAIDFGAAAARSPLLLPGPPPVPEGRPSDTGNPEKYIAGPSSFCTEWVAMVRQYADATRPWRERHDPNIPAGYWSPEQRKLADDTANTMQQNADRSQLLGLLSGNLVAADFAVLSAHYRRAYALALPSYGLPDTHLDNAALRLQALTNQACLAAQT